MRLKCRLRNGVHFVSRNLLAIHTFSPLLLEWTHICSIRFVGWWGFPQWKNNIPANNAPQEHIMTSSNGNNFFVNGHLCGNSPVTGEFPAQRPVTRSFDVFFDLRPNKRLSKWWWVWWFETPSRPLWHHCNEYSSSNKENNSSLLYFVGCIIHMIYLTIQIAKT